MKGFAASSLDLDGSSGDFAFDATLVGAATDAEEALLAPVLAPAVGDGPVRHAGLRVDAPADDLDGVAALERGAGRAVVHAARVRAEVREDVERGLDGHPYKKS